MKKSFVFFGILFLCGLACSKDDNDSIGDNNYLDKRDGKIYRTVKIGNQVWMAENLAYDIGAGCSVYDDEDSNLKIYGRLYTYEAALEACPDGWRIPTDEEWKELELYIGMDSAEINNEGIRGGEEKLADKLKSDTLWLENKNGTDDYGFSALPGGFYNRTSLQYEGIGVFVNFWGCVKDNQDFISGRNISYDTDGITRFAPYEISESNRMWVASVRCVKD